MDVNIPMVTQRRISLAELADLTANGKSVKQKQVGVDHIGNITIYGGSGSSGIEYNNVQRQRANVPQMGVQPSRQRMNTQSQVQSSTQRVNTVDLSEIFTSGNKGSQLVDLEFTWGLKGESQNYVIETEAFMLDQNGSALGEDWFIFYGLPESPDKSIILLESTSSIVRKMQLDLNKIDRRCKKIAFTMTVDDENHNGYSFRNVYNIRVIVRDRLTHKVLQKFNLPEFQGNPNATSLVVAEIYRYGTDWGIHMVGEGNPYDLIGLCQKYHIDASYN